MKNFRYLKNVSTISLDSQKCVGCGVCETVCPHGVFRVPAKKAEMVDYNGCIECGACSLNCPTEAIRVTPGVGCAMYIIQTWLKGSKITDCGCC